MAIQFEFYKNPQPEKEGEEPSYHPRVVNFQHVTNSATSKRNPHGNYFRKSRSRGNVNGTEQMQWAIICAKEKRVHLDGIGYFQITLQAAEPIHSLTTRADKVKLKSINFQADRDLKKFVYDHTPAAFEI